MFVNNNSKYELVINMLWSWVIYVFCCFFCKPEKVTARFKKSLINLFKIIPPHPEPHTLQIFTPLNICNPHLFHSACVFTYNNFFDSNVSVRKLESYTYELYLYFINTSNFFCLTWICILVSRWFYIFCNNWFYKNRKSPLN